MINGLFGKYCLAKTIAFFEPIDVLHGGHRGLKLSIFVFPPFDIGDDNIFKNMGII